MVTYGLADKELIVLVVLVELSCTMGIADSGRVVVAVALTFELYLCPANARVGRNQGQVRVLETVSILRNWEIIRDFVLVRELVESNRASPKPLNAKRVTFQNVEKEVAVLQELMKVDTGIFRHVLSFLIANVASD